MRRFCTTTFLFLVLASAAYADFDTGVAAYMRGDYNTAAQHLIPLAESADDAYAQYFLGAMYAKGQGVDQNMETAAKWYRSAAEKGVSSAQYRLGVMYRDGQGVPQDLENAYAWLSVAAKLGSQLAPTALASLDGRISPQEMTEAQKLAEEYIRKYGEPPKRTREGIDEPIKQGQ